MKKIDIIGKQFGYLTVLEEIGSKNKRLYYLCLCECGKKVPVEGSSLRYGNTKSCGCSVKTHPHHITHGLDKHPLLKKYRQMKQRVSPNSPKRKYYSDRGIGICDDWLGEDGIKNFFDWALNHSNYSEELTLERIDVNKGYSPDNCTWITMSEQRKNTTASHWLEFNGEKKILADWERDTGINRKTIINRIERGWSVERALTTPPRKGNKCQKN